MLCSSFFFSGFTFYKEALCFIIFILSLCSNMLNWKTTWIHRSKIKKNILILRFYRGMKCLHVFFSFFYPGMKFHSCLSFRDETSSRQKRVNSKRHFTIDRKDFIPWRVSSRDEISRVNTLYNSLPVSFPAWFLKKNVSLAIFYWLTKFHCRVLLTSWEIGQYVYL